MTDSPAQVPLAHLAQLGRETTRRAVMQRAFDEIYIDPRECGLLVRWAIHHYGGIRPALAMAESVAVWLLASNGAHREEGETTNESVAFYERFISTVKIQRHSGDCRLAPSWLIAPITCGPCVYEEYVAKAFECLRIENGGTLDAR